jgi:Rieske Fe-S protein
MTNDDHTEPIALSRRSVLAVGAAGASTLALAACSKAKTSSPPASSSTPASNAPSTGPTSSAAPPTESSGAAAQSLAKLSDIKVGEAISAKGPDGAKIIIARPTDGTVAAFSAICTHQGCTVAPAGKELDCPCHGSVYNAATGEVMGGPAPRPLDKVSVKIAGDSVVAG